MYPWLFLWAPQYHFPWSGAVSQDISPDTFFGAIAPEAGDGELEHEIFKTASYGKQIGILNDVVLSLLGEAAGKPRTAEGKHAVAQLQSTTIKVAAIKKKYTQRQLDTAVDVLRDLKKSNPGELKRIIAEL
jgi:hypothetical protein